MITPLWWRDNALWGAAGIGPLRLKQSLLWGARDRRELQDERTQVNRRQ